MLNIAKIYDAAKVLSKAAKKTDLIQSKTIIEDKELYLKSENLQVTGSFKLRGAYYKISKLTDEQKAKGIIACSAGNHAQGVALAAQKSGIKATIFIPATAPISKVEATRKYGADIKLIDGVYDDAYKAACEFQKETQGEFIHPFDDEDVIAGQGTIGLEILEQLPDIDSVIVPIGGGGLISGIAYAMKQLKPSCKIYGVQAQGAGSMYQSFINKKILELPAVHTFADGTAVKRPGNLTFELCEKYVDDIVTVSDDETASAILSLMEKQKIVAEGAGALSVAAAMFEKVPLTDKTVCIVSGGNIDVNILSRVINRGLLTAGRLSHLTIELLDKPGQLKDVSTTIAQYGANVIRVRHNQGGGHTDINACFLQISMETKNTQHFEEIKQALISKGYKITSDV
ncbi:MAG: threonine ammonia-lyase [Candidatus Avigastranaerophilus sp.]